MALFITVIVICAVAMVLIWRHCIIQIRIINLVGRLYTDQNIKEYLNELETAEKKTKNKKLKNYIYRAETSCLIMLDRYEEALEMLIKTDIKKLSIKEKATAYSNRIFLCFLTGKGEEACELYDKKKEYIDHFKDMMEINILGRINDALYKWDKKDKEGAEKSLKTAQKAAENTVLEAYPDKAVQHMVTEG